MDTVWCCTLFEEHVTMTSLLFTIYVIFHLNLAYELINLPRELTAKNIKPKARKSTSKVQKSTNKIYSFNLALDTTLKKLTGPTP